MIDKNKTQSDLRAAGSTARYMGSNAYALYDSQAANQIAAFRSVIDKDFVEVFPIAGDWNYVTDASAICLGDAFQITHELNRRTYEKRE